MAAPARAWRACCTARWWRERTIASTCTALRPRAPTTRTNYPHLRVDADHAESLDLARAFGARFIVHHRGTAGSLHRVAQASGRPSLVVEAGGPGRGEPALIDWLLKGLERLLASLGLVAGSPGPAAEPHLLRQTRWLRARRGGLLEYFAGLGQRVLPGQLLLGTTSVLGRGLERLHAPDRGVVLGLCTHPAVGPGDALLHLGLEAPASSPATGLPDELERKLCFELNAALRILEAPGT